MVALTQQVLRADSVSKSYWSKSGESKVALADASLNVAQGEFVSIIGPSGCGKSTFLQILAKLVEPTTGTVDYRGTGAPPEPKDYGFVFQQSALLPWASVLRNVMMPAVIGRSDRREAAGRAEDLLGLVMLPGIGKKLPQELSGGMRQRVAIARALFNRPDILFMDEPFGALDAMTRDDMGFELLSIMDQERCAVVFVTHSITEAVLLSDKIVVMSAGPGRFVETFRPEFRGSRDRDIVTSAEFRNVEADVRTALLERTTKGSS
ncbi:MAG: ABC transporter ATP-binding protein [Pseudonocardiaceae bacterium]|nr:MAG: ABC transporter ATP-binding protein [Pseudonocardiaceae bacterium]